MIFQEHSPYRHIDIGSLLLGVFSRERSLETALLETFSSLFYSLGSVLLEAIITEERSTRSPVSH
jgi:hypothetical protein